VKYLLFKLSFLYVCRLGRGKYFPLLFFISRHLVFIARAMYALLSELICVSVLFSSVTRAVSADLVGTVVLCLIVPCVSKIQKIEPNTVHYSVMQQLAVILFSILYICFNYCLLIDLIYALHLCIIHARGAERKLR
jgi:hypothetical protein